MGSSCPSTITSAALASSASSRLRRAGGEGMGVAAKCKGRIQSIVFFSTDAGTPVLVAPACYVHCCNAAASCAHPSADAARRAPTGVAVPQRLSQRLCLCLAPALPLWHALGLLHSQRLSHCHCHALHHRLRQRHFLAVAHCPPLCLHHLQRHPLALLHYLCHDPCHTHCSAQRLPLPPRQRHCHGHPQRLAQRPPQRHCQRTRQRLPRHCHPRRLAHRHAPCHALALAAALCL